MTLKTQLKSSVLTPFIIALASLFLTGCLANSQAASETTLLVESNTTIEHDELIAEEEANILIFHDASSDFRRYRVNGKTFYYSDLTEKQKSRLAPLEAKLKKAEELMELHEAELEEFEKNIEKHVRVLEQEVEKMELATIEIKQATIGFDDLDELHKRLEKVASINEKLIHKKELEIQKIEKNMPHIDESQLEALDKAAEALEAEIIKIAGEIAAN